MLNVTLDSQQLTVNQKNLVNLCFHNSSNETLTNIIFTLKLPGKILLLKGSRRVEISQLKPGQKSKYSLTVIPKAPGKDILTSPNFSYRNHLGKGERIKDFNLELNLLA